MGTAEGVGRSVGAPPPPSVVSSPRTLPPLIAIRACAGVRPHCAAIANLLARAGAAARFRIGLVRPLIHLIDRPLLHYCLLGVAGCGGRRIVWWEQQPKGSPVLRTRRPMEEQKMSTKDCLLILGSYVGVPRCNKHTGGENGVHQVFLIDEGGQAGYTLKL